MADSDPLSERHTSTSEEMDAAATHLLKQHENNTFISEANLKLQQKVERKTEIRWQDAVRAQNNAAREADQAQWWNLMGARKNTLQWRNDMAAMELQFRRRNEVLNLRHKQESEVLNLLHKQERKKVSDTLTILGVGFVGYLLLRSFLFQGPRLRSARLRSFLYR